MPKIYSQDLRERVLKYIEKTGDKNSASNLFQVGIATVYRWVLRKKQKGNVDPLRRKYAFKKVRDENLIKYVTENPDHFLSEIGDYFSVTPQAIFYCLKRFKITRKKSLLSIRKEMKRKEKITLKN